MFRVTSTDGKSFKVGCDCIRKTGDAWLVRQVDADVKKADKERREERKKAKIADAKLAAVPANCGVLANIPHPSPTLAGLGRTGLDYANWMAEGGFWESLASFLRRAIPE